MNTLQKFVYNLQQLVADNQMEMAITQMRRALEPLDTDIYNEVLVYSWQLKSFRQEFLKGLMDNHTYEMALTRVCNGLLSIISRMETTDSIRTRYGRYQTIEAPASDSLVVKLKTSSDRAPQPAYEFFDDFTIGRSDLCDITLPDPYISREHARFIVEGRKVLIEDLGSRNGTFIENTRLEPNVSVPVNTGCIIQFHTIPFALEIV